MSDRIDLADPDFEPTDEQLKGSMKRAFADVTRRHERAMAALRAEIERGQRDVLRALPGSTRP